jgi:hypothetical protein
MKKQDGVLQNFMDKGEWVVYNGNGGYELEPEIFDEIEEAEDIVKFYYDQSGRYVAVDKDDFCGYFYKKFHEEE